MPDIESTDEKQLLSGTSVDPSKSQLQSGQLDTSENLNPISQVAKYLGSGEQEVQNNQQNVWLMTNSMDDTKRLNMIKTGVTKVQSGFSQADQTSQPWYQGIERNVLQMLPQIGDTTLQGGGFAAGGAAIGAGIGTALEPGGGTVAGAALGGKIGFQIGAIKSQWEQSAGQMYGELREAGVDHDTAKTIGFTIGSINAGMGVLGINVIKGMAGKALVQSEKNEILKALSHDTVRQITKNMAGRFAMQNLVGTLEQTALGTGSAIFDEVGKTLAGIMQKHDPSAFTNWSTAAKHVQDAFLQALTTGAVISTGAQAAGGAAGKVLSETQKQFRQRVEIEKLQGATPTQILQKVQEHLNEQPNPWEGALPGEQPTVEQDEQGKVYIKQQVGKNGQQLLSDIVNNPQSQIQSGLQAIYPEEKLLTPKEIEEGKQLRLALQEWRPLNPTEVKARLNQLDSDIRIIKKEERRLESEITLKEKTGQSSQKLIDKWRNIGNTIDQLESEKDFLEKGLGTTVTEGAKYGQLRIKALARVFDNLTETANRLQKTKQELAKGQLRLPEIGFKKGTYETERTIRKIQGDLINVVNSITEDSAIRANVKQFVAGVTTPEKALKAIATIKEKALELEKKKFETLDEKDRAKTFNKVVGMLQGKRVTLQSGHPVSKLPADLAAKLEVLRTFLKSKKDLDAWQIKTAMEHGKTPIDQLPADVQFKLQLASMAQMLHNGTAIERNVTAGNIAQWIQDGEKIISDKRAELQQRKEEIISQAKQSMNVGGKTIKYTTSQWDDIKHRTYDLSSTGMTWNTLWDILSPKDSEHGISKILDESASRHHYLASVKATELNMTQSIEQNMKSQGFKGSLIQKISDDNNTLVKMTYTDSSGKAMQLEITRGQALDIYLKYKDGTLHTALQEGNGFTLPGETSTIGRIESILKPEDHAQINAILDFYQDYHGSVNDAYKNKYGTDLPMRDNYSPVTRKGYQVDAPYSQEGLQFGTLLPGSARTRLDSKLPLQFNNPMQDAVRHVQQWEYFKHYTDLLDTVGHVLTDSDIRSHIRDNYGSGTLKVLDDFHERFIKNDPVPSIPGNGWWAAIRGDFSNAIMGFRLNQFFTILPHGVNTWASYSVSDILHGIRNTILHPLETEQALRQSPVFAQRYRAGTNYELENAMHQSGLFANTIGKALGVEPTLEDSQTNSAIKRFMYAAHIGADVAIQRIFGGPIYHAEIKKGATPEEALIATERAIEQTQPGHSVSQTPFINTNPIASTLVAQYTQHPSQVMGKSIVAVRDWANNMNDPKAWLTLGGKIGALWAIPGALSATAAMAPLLIANPALNEDQKREAGYGILGGAVMGPLVGEPVIGDLVQSIWFQAAKPLIGVDESQRGGLSRGNFISDVYDNTKQALQKWNKLGEPQDITKLPDIAKEEKLEYQAKSATAKAITMGLGLPQILGTGPLNVTQRAEQGDLAGAAFAAAGWSPGLLAKRTPETLEQYLRKLEKGGLTDTKTSTYDTMQTYLNSLFKHEPPPKSSEEQSPAIKAFIEEQTK